MSKNALQKYEGDPADNILRKAGNGATILGIGIVVGAWGILPGIVAGAAYGSWKLYRWGKKKAD